MNAHRNAITVLDGKNSKISSELQTVKVDQLEETRRLYLTIESSEGEISVEGLPGVQLIQLTEEEEKEIGDVWWKPFFYYIHISKGLLFLSSCVVTQSAFVTLQAVSSYWLAFAVQIPSISSGILIGVYTAMSIIGAFFACLRSLLASLLGLKASKAFFSGFINSIFNAPMSFFDSTPIGRILARVRVSLFFRKILVAPYYHNVTLF